MHAALFLQNNAIRIMTSPLSAALFVQNNAIRIMTCQLSAALFDRNNASMNIGAYAIFRSHHSRRILARIMITE